MQTKTKFIIFIVLIVIIIGGVGIYVSLKPQAPGKLDGFAQCINDSGAKFYGAFWCSHCQDQKNDFGSSKQYIPYVECANPDNTQKQICIDEGIDGYPTWTFSDGSELSGRLSFEVLAEKTQCVIPQ